MKRLISIALALLLLTACGTAQQPHEPGSSTVGSTAASTSTVTKTRPDITMVRELEQDGLLLRVWTNYQHYFAGETIRLEASVTNRSNHTITYGVGSGTPNVHLEIPVRIPGPADAPFTDQDVYGKMWTEDYIFAVLKPGETLTETIQFLPGTPQNNTGEISDLQQMHWFPQGEYTGTATFTRFSGAGDNPGEPTQLKLEFPVILV